MHLCLINATFNVYTFNSSLLYFIAVALPRNRAYTWPHRLRYWFRPTLGYRREISVYSLDLL